MTEDLERTMVSLFRQQPDAVEELECRMEERSEAARRDIPESFRQIYKWASEAAQQDTL